MITLLVSIKDRAVEAFQGIMTVRTQGEALRAFQDAIRNPESRNLHNHPDDHDLYIIGDFNDQDGTVTPRTPPEKIADGKATAEAMQQPKGEV